MHLFGRDPTKDWSVSVQLAGSVEVTDRQLQVTGRLVRDRRQKRVIFADDQSVSLQDFICAEVVWNHVLKAFRLFQRFDFRE